MATTEDDFSFPFIACDGSVHEVHVAFMRRLPMITLVGPAHLREFRQRLHDTGFAGLMPRMRILVSVPTPDDRDAQRMLLRSTQALADQFAVAMDQRGLLEVRRRS